MPRTLVFAATLLALLAGLAYAGDAAWRRTVRRWVDADVTLRSRLAVAAADASLTEQWRAGDGRLQRTLVAIARDERVLGVAACSEDGALLAVTASMPDAVTCREVSRSARRRAVDSLPYTRIVDLDSTALHIAAVPITTPIDGGGFVVLVHDLRYAVVRASSARRQILTAFLLLALSASGVTVLAAALAQRQWLLALRRALAGEDTPALRPLVREIRALARHLAGDPTEKALEGSWTAERLRHTLVRLLDGERLVILANREPYIHQRVDGEIRVMQPASGLVTALEPVLRACSGTWEAHGSGTADRDVVDRYDRVAVPPGEPAYQLRRVWLTEAEEQGYYYGLSNEGLWPLCHVAHARPTFRIEDWAHYRAVNQRFADAVCEEVDGDDPIVLVQDYHFALAPRMIRDRLPGATIITFWHIPWPNAERIGICPWHEELLEGLLGSSVLAFHTQQHCNHFLDAVDAYLEARIDRESVAIVQGKRRTLVRSYPISIEWPMRRLEGALSVAAARQAVCAEFGLPAGTRIGVGVDRLDYTKGIEERFGAVDRLLATHPELVGRFVFIQIAAPSRSKIDHYRDLDARVTALAAEINGRWQRGAYRPILLQRSHHEPADVIRYFRAADLCYVSSLHDGMNLVAKEFVAARDDAQGVLVLSRFTGAARELTEALIVNPYDLDESTQALAAALAMPVAEQQVRMRAMRRLVSEFNVYRWAGQMLLDAADLRQRERLHGRLQHTPLQR
ncbi:MAG: trehalose-6-phosphate synthase [Gemmatimonadaceae bacterium]|nr:trehalose-6-phosphate synthase [Gemmatimonadaceae bacterium]